VTRSHVFAPAAAADVRDITRYTLEEWGAAQARRYVAQIEQVAAGLASGSLPFRDLSTVLPGLRVAMSGKHHVFCLLRPGQPALILAILHERMDLMARLQDRLRV
jgi:plasmid stabilization system protein ParE